MTGTRAVPRSLLVVALVTALSAQAAPPDRTWNYLTTGNGHGFQIYDVNRNKIIAFLDHPYRYVSPPAGDRRADGPGRRNLAFDLFFGLRAGGGSGWLGGNNGAVADGDPAYVAESNIIRVPMRLAGVAAESYFFAPFGYEGNALVALLKAPGAQEGYLLLNFHMGTGSPDSPNPDGERLRLIPAQQALVETGNGKGAMVYVPLSGVDRMDCDRVFAKVRDGQPLVDNTGCSGFDVVPALGRRLGADGWMAAAVLYVQSEGDAEAAARNIRMWAAGRSPEQILGEALAEWERWRRPPPAQVSLSADERRLWRQSEAVLRMGQIREPYTGALTNHGMILASLPPGEWHTGWVRDAMYAIVALARTGHRAEAKAALNFFLDVPKGRVGLFSDQVSGAKDYRVSVVRYYGNGEEEADYSGEPTPNIEVDGWGMMMWTARQYVDATSDPGWLNEKTKRGDTVYDAIRSGVAEALMIHSEDNGIIKKDSSIWEVHQAREKHFAYTTLAAIRGYCDMATLALRAGRMADVQRYRDHSYRIEQAFFKAFLDREGAIGGSIEELTEGKYLDAAVVEAFTWDIVNDYESQTAKATLRRLQELRVRSGGFKRNDDGRSSYDNNEWILIDLRMTDAMRRARDTAPADALLGTVVSTAAKNFYLLPELYDAEFANPRYTGSIPMVGYGAGAFIMTVLDRAGLFEPSDCGMSTLDADGGVVVADGGRRPGIGGMGDGAPRVTACICRIGGAGPQGGTAALLLLPWLLLLGRLTLRRAAGRL